jgi:hypothetical protein
MGPQGSDSKQERHAGHKEYGDADHAAIPVAASSEASGVQQAWMRRPLRNDLPCAKVYMTFSVEMPVWR